MAPLRIGFVGLGGICRKRHVPGFRQVPDVELVAVANRTRESSERAAADCDLPDVCDTWEELVARGDLDIVVIGTWPYMHRPVTMAALDAGKHVLCQARMAMDYVDAKAMYDRARTSDRVTGLCPVPIGLKIDATIRRLLREGELGDLRLVRVQSLSSAFVDPRAAATWRKDHRYSGLNMHTLGMYLEVIHRWFGWTTRVTATTQTFVRERVTPANERITIRIPDQVLFSATVQAGMPVQYTISTVAQYGGDRIEIYGTKMSLLYDVGEDALYRMTDRGTAQPVEMRPEDFYDVKTWRVEQDFVDAIRAGKPYHPNFEEGLRYMQATQAVYDSAEQGRTVQLD
jgi:predicted dehydrogenase